MPGEQETPPTRRARTLRSSNERPATSSHDGAHVTDGNQSAASPRARTPPIGKGGKATHWLARPVREQKRGHVACPAANWPVWVTWGGVRLSAVVVVFVVVLDGASHVTHEKEGGGAMGILPLHRNT